MRSAGLGDRGLRVVRQPRVHLDGHPPVHAVGRVVDRAQHVTGPAHVERCQSAQRLADRDPPSGQVGELSSVGVPVADRLSEDRGVGGYPRHVIVRHELGQAAGSQPFPTEIVQPDRHPSRAARPIDRS